MKTWFEIKNDASADKAEIRIFDSIGGWGVSARDFIAELKGISAPSIEVVINSPGGSVFEGLAIFNAIAQMGARVTTRVDGLAASIASVIALAGSKVRMAKNSFIFVHNPSGTVMGPASEMRKMADTLDKLRDSIAGIYADKTGMTTGDAAKMMDDERWLDAEEADALGFVDEVTPSIQATACFDASALTMFNDAERAALSQAKAEGCFDGVLAAFLSEKIR